MASGLGQGPKRPLERANDRSGNSGLARPWICVLVCAIVLCEVMPVHSRIEIYHWLRGYNEGDTSNSTSNYENDTYTGGLQDNQGDNKDRQTLILMSSSIYHRHRYRVAIRQHNMAVEVRYKLEARLNCLFNYAGGPPPVIPAGEVRTKWYFDNKRIRKQLLETYRYSLEKNKSVLVLSEFQEKENNTEQLNGVYHCAVYDNNRVILAQEFEVKIFFPGVIDAWDSSGMVQLLKKNRPKKAFLTFSPQSTGLVWAQVNWRLGESEHVYNRGNVTLLRLEVVHLLSTGSVPAEVVRIHDPDEYGSYNLTGLTPNTSYKVKTKTFNVDTSLTYATYNFSTDRMAEVECEPEELVVPAGTNVTVICRRLGRPLPEYSERTVDTSSKSFIGHDIIKFSWENMRRPQAKRETCFRIYNIYNSVNHCIRKTIYCRPLPLLENGQNNVENATTVNAKTFFTCNRGYYLDGPAERQCVENVSEWDGRQPVCLEHESPNASIAETYAFMSSERSVDVFCHTAGVPPPAVHWLIDNQTVESANATSMLITVRHGAHGSLIRIKALSAMPPQSLQCVATNVMGTVQSVAMLYTSTGPVEQHLSIYEHESLNLTCMGISDLQNVRWTKLIRSGEHTPSSLTIDTGSSSISLPPAELDEVTDVACANDPSTILQLFRVQRTPAVHFAGVTPQPDGNQKLYFKFGEPVRVQCDFASNFSGLTSSLDFNNSQRGDGVTVKDNPKRQASKLLVIDIFEPKHEGEIVCTGAVVHGKTSRTFTLTGLQSGTCVVHNRTGVCAEYMAGIPVFTPVLDGNGGRVSASDILRIRTDMYRRAVAIFNTTDSEPCFQLVHRMLCEYIFSPCDDHSVKFAPQNKSWQRPVCEGDCLVASENLCAGKWKEFLRDMSEIDPDETMGSLQCAGLRPASGGRRVECVKSLRFASASLTRTDDCVCGDGSGYTGRVSETNERRTCLTWRRGSDSVDANASYPWATTTINHCRNPEGRAEQPWCYTAAGWGKCAVKTCRQDIRAQGCQRYSGAGAVCSDVSLITSNWVKSRDTAAAVEAANVNQLLADSGLDAQCSSHLKRLLCLNAYHVCDRDSASSCGQTRTVCPAYCEAFNSECPVEASTKRRLEELLGYNMLDCDAETYDSEEHRRHDRCLHVMTGFKADVVPSAPGCGSLFESSVSITKSNRTCQPWNFSLPHRPAAHINEYALTGNKCRNPGGLAPRPWCYTMDPEMRWEECDIDICKEAAQSPSSADNPTATSVAVVLSVLLIFGVGAFMVFRYKRRANVSERMKFSAGDFHPKPAITLEPNDSPPDGRKPSRRFNNPPTLVVRDNPEYWLTSPDLFGINKLQHEQLEFTAQIAEGHFGMVWCGTAKDLVPGEDKTTVAIKTLKSDCNEQTELGFIKEAQVISRFKHVNIIRLLGVCIPNGCSGQPLCLLFEYMEYGDLLHFLREAQRRRRPTVDLKGRNLSIESADSIRKERTQLASTSTEISVFDKPLTQLDLCGMAAQVAHGMQYLSAQRYVHRDLAARNCLVGRNHIVKLADFGLSRDVMNRDYYRPRGNWAAMPVRWMPPEVIMYGKHTAESDVWSFGVLLWEVFTYGAVPYYDLSNEEVVKRVCEQDRRLPQPHECPPVIYGLMQECWFDIAEERPAFRRLWKALHTWRPPHCVGTSDYASGGTDSDPENISKTSDDVFEESVQPMPTMVISPHGSRVPKNEPGRGSLTSPLLPHGITGSSLDHGERSLSAAHMSRGNRSEQQMVRAAAPVDSRPAQEPPSPSLPYIPQSSSLQPLSEPSPQHDSSEVVA